VVIGSRYTKGGAIQGWPFRRRLISGTANAVARLLLGLPIRDCTGGFKCFRRSTLESVNFAHVRSRGFAFLFEFSYLCHRLGKVFREVPIKFVDRQAGESKLSLKIVLEALIMVLRLRLSGGRGGTLSGARP